MQIVKLVIFNSGGDKNGMPARIAVLTHNSGLAGRACSRRASPVARLSDINVINGSSRRGPILRAMR